jgi:uncharacterized protein GlcG (DUF336 family)
MSMNAELARNLMEAAVAKASGEYGRPICVSVCDETGLLMAFFRMDGAPLRTISIAQQKAYTAVRMGSTTEAFLERLRREQVEMAYFGDTGLTALPGGSPVRDPQGRIKGAVGVSGLKPSEDQALADQLAGIF